MNIFVLDTDPQRAAQYHCDKHISKMILESAQMLSTVLGGSYKPTHKNHPCTKWVAESRSNASWLIALTYALNQEWQMRYLHHSSHKSLIVVEQLVDTCAINALPSIGLTPFAQAMPDQYKHEDPVVAYRTYYKSKTFAKWAHGPTPHWW